MKPKTEKTHPASFAAVLAACLLALTAPASCAATCWQAPPEPVDLSIRADVLIVTSPNLSQAWKPFANWKTATGRPAKVVTTDEISERYEGKDIQQKIRACCLDHIENHSTKSVVLGGDSSPDAGVVPDRDTDHTDCKMLSYNNIPTDLYFISDGDWDANDDGVYGNFSDDLDAVNYFNPDAVIGRIPLRTANDVQAYTAKVIAYESAYPGDDFASRMVYTCPEEMAYPKLETSIEKVGDSWPGGTVNRFFGNRSPWDEDSPGDHDLSAANWTRMLNEQQASKLHMHGHGLLPLWVLENGSQVDAKVVDGLANENAYPIITTVSCLTGQFDNRSDPSIAELMLRKPAAGAIAIIAPSREGVPFMHSRRDFQRMITEGKMDGTTTAMTRFWKAALESNITLGEAFRRVKMEMEPDARRNDGFHMCQCELNLLGDPTLSARPSPPDNFDPQIETTDELDVIVSGVDSENATVCVWDGANQYFLITPENGTARVQLEQPATEIQVSVFATGYNIFHKTLSP